MGMGWLNFLFPMYAVRNLLTQNLLMCCTNHGWLGLAHQQVEYTALFCKFYVHLKCKLMVTKHLPSPKRLLRHTTLFCVFLNIIPRSKR